mgnify:CR=1 FL=1
MIQLGVSRDPVADALVSSLDMRSLLEVRRLLRSLARETDALAAFLVMKERIVEYAGDLDAAPRRLPSLRSTVVCVDERCTRAP